MAEQNYAVVEVLCPADQLTALGAIPNLVLEKRPIRTDDPTVVRIYAKADDAAQAAARALGATVTVLKTAEELRAQIEEAYRDLGKGSDEPGRS
jgi:hypothetical protein